MNASDFAGIFTAVPRGSTYVDDRGEIAKLFDTHLAIGSVSLITSKKGSVRAQHFHKETGWHYCYVIKGAIRYLERPVGSKAAPRASVFVDGDVFFTPPQVEHAMEFLEDTEFLCLSGNERSQEAYEADLVRLTELLK